MLPDLCGNCQLCIGLAVFWPENRGAGHRMTAKAGRSGVATRLTSLLAAVASPARGGAGPPTGEHAVATETSHVSANPFRDLALLAQDIANVEKLAYCRADLSKRPAAQDLKEIPRIIRNFKWDGPQPSEEFLKGMEDAFRESAKARNLTLAQSRSQLQLDLAEVSKLLEDPPGWRVSRSAKLNHLSTQSLELHGSARLYSAGITYENVLGSLHAVCKASEDLMAFAADHEGSSVGLIRQRKKVSGLGEVIGLDGEFARLIHEAWLAANDLLALAVVVDGCLASEMGPQWNAMLGKAMMTPRDIAETFSVPLAPLEGRLRRWRTQNQDRYGIDWIDNQDRRSRQSKYLYKISAILPIVKALRNDAAHTK
jgi:hypothetical protein